MEMPDLWVQKLKPEAKMGDYVDKFGKGRNFTPSQLDRVVDRFEKLPKTKPVRLFECS